MRRFALLLVLTAGAVAQGQDSSFSVFRLRAGLLRMPVIGHIGDDWSSGSGGHVDLASNVGKAELALGVGRMDFTATTGKPSFTETLFSLTWSLPIVSRTRVELASGARLTDIRLDFDDPVIVGGLRNEEEQLISAVSRVRLSLFRKYSGFVEGSYGLLMSSTRTPTMTLVIGLQRDGAMPDWLRAFLR